MNIFVTNWMPEPSARDLCDQHIRGKMVLENVQMLSTCLRFYYPEFSDTLDSLGIYKSCKSHLNHPCNLWLRESPFNVHWLVMHTLEMEMIREGAGYKPHKSMKVLQEIIHFKEAVDNGEVFRNRFPKGTCNANTVPFLAMPLALQKEYGEIAIPAPTKYRKDVYRGWTWIHTESAYQRFVANKVFKDGSIPTWTVNKEPAWVQSCRQLNTH